MIFNISSLSSTFATPTLKNASFIDCTFLCSRAFSFLMIAKNGSESLLTSWLVSWKSILGAKIDSAVWMCLILKACSGLQWFETRYHFSYRVAKRTWKQSDFSTQKECISQGCNGFVSEAEDGRVHYLKSFQEKKWRCIVDQFLKLDHNLSRNVQLSLKFKMLLLKNNFSKHLNRKQMRVYFRLCVHTRM